MFTQVQSKSQIHSVLLLPSLRIVCVWVCVFVRVCDRGRGVWVRFYACVWERGVHVCVSANFEWKSRFLASLQCIAQKQENDLQSNKTISSSLSLSLPLPFSLPVSLPFSLSLSPSLPLSLSFSLTLSLSPPLPLSLSSVLYLGRKHLLIANGQLWTNLGF